MSRDEMMNIDQLTCVKMSLKQTSATVSESRTAIRKIRQNSVLSKQLVDGSKQLAEEVKRALEVASRIGHRSQNSS